MNLKQIYVWRTRKEGVCRPTEADLVDAKVYSEVPDELNEGSAADARTKVHAVYDNGKKLDVYWGHRESDWELRWVGANDWCALEDMLNEVPDLMPDKLY